jgi:long-chain acyl-CoA synthetase
LVGDFVEGWEHKIVSKQLYVRGPHVMLGYWNAPEATNAKIDSEGWLATGDEVEIDPATNQIKVLGRVDEVIVLDNAVKIHPRTIEQIVDTIEGISRSILIYQRSLQLWIDLQDQQTISSDHQELIREQVAAVVGTNIGGNPYSVHFFSHRLEGNEITSKGTTRRAQIIKNRFET